MSPPFQIPQPRGSVQTSSYRPAVVWAEGHDHNIMLMASEHDGLGGGIGRFSSGMLFCFRACTFTV